VQRPAISRHERFHRAVAGLPVDRVPVSAWMHFGSEHLDADMAAQLHQRYWQAYGWDVLKVMADYRFEVPTTLRHFDSAAQIAAIKPPTQHAPCFAEQLRCMTQLVATIGREVPLLDSGYDPYTLLLRHIGRDQAPHLWAHPKATQNLLTQITEGICEHLQRLKALGVTGYFHATHAAIPEGQPRGLSQEVYEHFVRPFDLAILQAAQGMVRVLHAHGTGIELARLEGYPFEVIHLSDRSMGNPSLSDLRRWTDRCVMGGIDETGFTSASLANLAAQMTDAVEQAGSQGLMLAPGCAVSASSARRSLQFLRDFLSVGVMQRPLCDADSVLST
jgi:uroporphyrinogen decarboxylase